MKPVSAELLDLITHPRARLAQAELFTFAGDNLGANVLRFAQFDTDLEVNGFTYACGSQTGPYFGRKDNKAKMHWKVGTAVDTLTFDVVLGSAQLFGVPWAQAIRSGVFDGATLLVERVFMPIGTTDTSRGTVRLFSGLVAAIDCGGEIATFTVNSFMAKLGYPIPRNLYQPGCVNLLGDAACGVNQASYAYSGSVSGTSSNSSIVASLPGYGSTIASGSLTPFNLGKIVWTSGALNGLSRTVRSCTGGAGSATINVLGWFPSAPAIGDTFTLYFGCDKSDGADGCAKFANTARYKGFPNVPQPTTAA